MPNFVCSAPLGRLTPVQKTAIAQKITDIYHEETGGARYMVEVIFHDLASCNYYVAGRPAPADQICIRGDTRSGKTNEQKNQMVRRLTRDVARASGGAEEAVSVILCELPAANFVHYGRVVPAPGEEDAWFSSLPDVLQERLRRLA
jgi:phenylpyruvate tautomerase PptA (4-oxalocrotonate tautomerase family)